MFGRGAGHAKARGVFKRSIVLKELVLADHPVIGEHLRRSQTIRRQQLAIGTETREVRKYCYKTKKLK